MKFEEVLPKLRSGSRIKRVKWGDDFCLFAEDGDVWWHVNGQSTGGYDFFGTEILCDDWEVVGAQTSSPGQER